MTSGSWRSAARSAAAKLAVSMPTSRWLMLDIRSLCMNSIGSSTVTMCSARVAFRCAIMLAIDVLFPLPAAPTTSTIPFCFSTSSLVTGIGSSRSSIGGMSVGMMRITTASDPALAVHVHAEPPDARREIRRVVLRQAVEAREHVRLA